MSEHNKNRARFISSACHQICLQTAVTGRRVFLAAFAVLAPLPAAAVFDPVTEVFRLSAGHHLIVDRGGPVDWAGDVNGDGLDDVLIGSGVGGVRVLFGPTNGNNGVLNGQQLDGVSGFIVNHDDVNISVVSGLGDVNDDGFDDLIVGSLGGTQVVFGRNGGFDRFVNPTDLNGRNGFRFASAATSVSAAGDVNGDGIPDIIVGNGHGSHNGKSGAGITYVIYGSRNAYPATVQPSTLNGANGFAVLGVNSEDRAGQFVGAAGDFNHDGVDDFMIGAPNKTQDGRAQAGEAYVVFGSRTGHPAAISLYDIDGRNGFVFRGGDIQDSAGSAVTGIGDLNHDGVDDIAIGAPGRGPFGVPSDYPGETYVLFGGNFVGNPVVREGDLNGSNGFVARGIRGGVVPIEQDEAIWGDLAGTSLDTAGDFNNDGIDDLMIGASHTIRNARRKGVGQTYIVYGSIGGFPVRMQLSDLDGANGFRFNGIGTTDYFGVYVRQAGDFNDDGKNDVIIGASGEGATYIMYGRDDSLDFPPPTMPARNPSQGAFRAVAINVMSDADPLRLRELRDPTGPNALPVGTPFAADNPDTPGYVAPNPVDSILRLPDAIAATDIQGSNGGGGTGGVISDAEVNDPSSQESPDSNSESGDTTMDGSGGDSSNGDPTDTGTQGTGEDPPQAGQSSVSAGSFSGFSIFLLLLAGRYRRETLR